jgi:hypothetical protein
VCKIEFKMGVAKTTCLYASTFFYGEKVSDASVESKFQLCPSGRIILFATLGQRTKKSFQPLTLFVIFVCVTSVPESPPPFYEMVVHTE